MAHRYLAAAVTVVAIAALAPVDAGGQTQAGESSAWTSPRTGWGDPDLQGRWTNTTTTPLERPSDLAGRELLSEEERAALDEAGDVAREQRGVAAGTGETGSYNNFWVERGVRMARTSLIVDPPDGRLPPFTPFEAARRPARESYRTRVPAGPEDRNLYERCISRGMPGTMMPGFYNHNYQIFQAPGYVIVFQELIHEARIIPLDGRPHVPGSIRLWMGDSRGHWEGDTLVVVTTNFGPKTSSWGSRDTLHLTERYTRVDADTIDYRFTIDDPHTFTRPWTVARPMTRIADRRSIFEYACHEGNYSMEGILAGARAAERAAAAGGDGR